MFLGLSGMTLVSGCAGSLLGNAVVAASLAIKGIDDAPISKEYVASLPWASMGVKIGAGQRSMLVLGRYDNAERHWISADRATIATWNGRLSRVIGLAAELRETRDLGDDPIAGQTFEFAGTHTRSVDLGPEPRFGVIIQSRFEIVRRETITILDEQRDTLRVRESNTARTVRWQFDNEFWLDFHTGYCWRSAQHFHPGQPAIELEVFKRDA